MRPPPAAFMCLAASAAASTEPVSATSMVASQDSRVSPRKGTGSYAAAAVTRAAIPPKCATC